MGSGTGVATGLGKLNRFGLEQPVLATCGDSTFFHAAIPALVNGVHNQSDFILIILDNAGTAMTGFQPHPGTGVSGMGIPAHEVKIEEIAKAVGVKHVFTVDPYDVKNAIQIFKDAMKNAGLSIELGDITRADNAQYTIAKGCLIAAENSN